MLILKAQPHEWDSDPPFVGGVGMPQQLSGSQLVLPLSVPSSVSGRPIRIVAFCTKGSLAFEAPARAQSNSRTRKWGWSWAGM